MKVITGDRGTGKTVALIKQSSESGAYIVVAHRNLAVWTANKAREMGLKIPFPLTFDELLDGRSTYGNGMKYHVLIDDVDLLLRHLVRSIPIDGFTVNAAAEHYMHLTAAGSRQGEDN